MTLVSRAKNLAIRAKPFIFTLVFLILLAVIAAVRDAQLENVELAKVANMYSLEPNWATVTYFVQCRLVGSGRPRNEVEREISMIAQVQSGFNHKKVGVVYPFFGLIYLPRLIGDGLIVDYDDNENVLRAYARIRISEREGGDGHNLRKINC